MGKIPLEFIQECIMRDHAISRWESPLMAFCLSFVIIATLASATGILVERQIDFWLLWLATMVVLALPICYLEIALAKRSKKTALQALSGLTRDAEASSKWRLVGWLAVIFIPFLVGAIVSNAATFVTTFALPTLATPISFVVLVIVSLGLSFLARHILLVLTLITVIASLVLANVMGTTLPDWEVTPLAFSEWGSATILALVATGLGLGIYWQTALPNVQKEDVATKTVLPIWIAQLLAVVAFGFFSLTTEVPAFVFIIASVSLAAILLQLAREQLAERQINPMIQWAILLVAMLIWAIPASQAIFTIVLVLLGLVLCFVYAVFAGWIMKISHLRKSMNFSNEALYNLWRIAVRVVLPLAIVLAMISYIGRIL